MIGKANKGRTERFILKLPNLEVGTAPIKRDPYSSNYEYLVLLNKNNSNIIENLLKKDEAYYPYTRDVVEKYLVNGRFPFSEYVPVFAVIRMIDIENSTNVWRFNRNKLRNMVRYINSISNFQDRLLDSDKNKRAKLVDELVAKSNISDNDETEEGAQPKSLASKVCKYFAEYISKNDDWYFINDSFIRKVLPYYQRYYGVVKASNINNMNYVSLFNELEKLYIEVNKDKEEKITRGQMDHIMWYCYKNSGNEDEYEQIEEEK